MSDTIALVPLRSPGRGKTRLRHSLRAEHRAALSGAMFADVIAALRQSPIDRIMVAASGPEAVAAASALDLEVGVDPASVSTLDEAIAAAVRRADRATSLLVAAADLPRLTSGDVEAVLASDAEVVVAPTRGGGTGGLLRRPASRIITAYGAASAQRHRELAAAAGATFASVSCRGFHDDVDTHTDLAELISGPLGPATSRLLASWSDAGELTG